jgi:hypothetical protein
MIRITLIILLGLSIFVSFSAQAGNRNGHYNKHQGGHNHKHQRHHNRHHGHHKYSHGARGYRYQQNSYYGYGLYPRLYAVPNVPLGTRYGYSASGALIVYQPNPYTDHRY